MPTSVSAGVPVSRTACLSAPTASRLPPSRMTSSVPPTISSTPKPAMGLLIGDGIADRGVAKVAILREYRDFRFPQGELIALERGPDFVTEPALLALQRTQPGDVD